MRILAAILFFVCSAANAQFVTGQILTAAQLNAAFANVLSLSGGTLTGPLTVQGGTTVANLTVNGTFTFPGGFSPSSLAPQAANTDLANVTGASASPAAVAIPSCSTANSAIKYTSGTGWGCGTAFALTSGTLAQFSATTSAQLAGIISDETGTGSAVFGTSPTIATPAITGGTISGTPISGSTGSFTTLTASSTVSGAGFTSLLSPYLTTSTATSTYATIAQATTALAATGGSINGVTVGATTPSTGAFTTLSASSTVSGTGFSTYLASPPAIGGTTAASGKFTTLQGTTSIALTNLVSSSTAPTIASGFGTSPTIPQNNGTAAFAVKIGTGGTATNGVLTMPAAITGWICDATDVSSITTTDFYVKMTASSTTSVTLTMFNTAGAASAFGAGDFVLVKCSAY